MGRFDVWFNVRMSPSMKAAVIREARSRQQTISVFIRDAVLAELKQSGVRVRPLRIKQQPNKQTEASP